MDYEELKKVRWLLLAWMGLVCLPYLSAWAQTIRRVRDPRYRLDVSDAKAEAGIKVSVIIPARNEVDDIAGAVESVLNQDHPSVEMVVLDDGSTDGTSECLAAMSDERLKVVSGGDDPLPSGWLGKPWACHRAAKQATGEWLLFIDADVRLSPEAVSRSVHYANQNQLGLLSGLGQLVNISFGERILQPIVTGLIIGANDLAEVNDPERPDKALASGQFLLFRREAYEAIGGHQAVQGNVLDDVGLGLAAKGAGIGFQCVHMRSLYRCRMYASGMDCWRGWRKNLFPGMERKWSLAIMIWVFFFVALCAPLLTGLYAIIVGDWFLALAALAPLSLMHGLRFYLDGVYGQSRLFGLMTHMLGQLLFATLVLDSAWFTTRGRATWKGRVIPPQSS